MKRETFDDNTIIYTLDDDTKLLDNVTLDHVSFHRDVAVGKTKPIGNIRFKNTADVPVVGVAFWCLLTKDLEVKLWETI